MHVTLACQNHVVFCMVTRIYTNFQADQSGTIVEIIAEDGKPVSVDTV